MPGAEGCPQVRSMRGDRDALTEALLPLSLAFPPSQGLGGWEGLKLPYERGRDAVTLTLDLGLSEDPVASILKAQRQHRGGDFPKVTQQSRLWFRACAESLKG